VLFRTLETGWELLRDRLGIIICETEEKETFEINQNSKKKLNFLAELK
jgi:hypothetical protein